VPKPKPLTKWQQFAQKKGIVKKKQSKFVWDETKQDWGRRYGYKKANDDSKPWLIEVPTSAGLF
jgi:regulator of ribosome biosynthesis